METRQWTCKSPAEFLLLIHCPKLSSSWESLLLHGFKNTEMSHYIWNGQEKYTTCQSGRHLTKDLEWGVWIFIFQSTFSKLPFENLEVVYKSHLIWGLVKFRVEDRSHNEMKGKWWAVKLKFQKQISSFTFR